MKKLLFLILIILATSCAAGSNNIGDNQIMSERYATLREQRDAFSVNLIPPEGGRSLWEGKALEDPFSEMVVPGKTYNVEIDTQDGTAYKGTIQVINKGGSIGRYGGYEVKFTRYIAEMLRHDKQVAFYINTADGKQILLVTFYAP